MRLFQNILVNWAEFDVEYHRRCSYDWVEVFDGPDASSKSLGRFCNGKLPSAMKSSGNSLMIQLKTDESVNGNGFSLNFKSESPEDPGMYSRLIHYHYPAVNIYINTRQIGTGMASFVSIYVPFVMFIYTW